MLSKKVKQRLDYLFGESFYRYKHHNKVLSIYDRAGNLLVRNFSEFKDEDIPKEKEKWVCKNYDPFLRGSIVDETLTILGTGVWQGSLVFKVWSDLYKLESHVNLAFILKFCDKR